MTRWLAAALATAALAIASTAVSAEPLPGGAAFGMTVPQLQQAQPALARVPHPTRMAGGLVGSWSASAIDVAGVALTPTFFFADGQLQRVEYLAREPGSAAFSALLAWGRAAWGAELGATEPEGAYASWSSGELQAYLQLASPSRGSQVRLVLKPLVEKDADEL